MMSLKIRKILRYGLGIIFLFLLIGAFMGGRYFNNMWFKERPENLTIVSDLEPMNFHWVEQTYGDYIENRDGILVDAKIEGVHQHLYFQFDTGDPITRIYGNVLESLKQSGLDLNEVLINKQKFIEEINIEIGGSQISMGMIEISEGYGEPFGVGDTISDIRIGTIGADFMNKYITEIDFKNEYIRFYEERQHWMTANNEFISFDFTGRRFMLPCKVDNREFELFYDSGSSAFGLITIKKRYESYSSADSKEIVYDANRHGDPVPVRHKSTDKVMNIGGLNLEIKRVSYVDMYSGFQSLITPFTKIGGWLGNRPFTEYSLIFDAAKEKFVVVEK